MEHQNTSTVPAIVNKKGMTACIVISVAVIGLYFVPYGNIILYPFMLIYTFVHEMGHGISAVLMGGEFSNFKMWFDGSGVASYSMLVSASRLAKAFVAFGGLVAPAVMAAVCLILGRSGKASRIGLYIFAGICALSLLLVVRNLFGFIFVLLCGAAAGALAKLPKSNTVPQYSMLILAITLLTAVFSRGDYLFTAVANTSEGVMPSDVGQIAEYLFLPYWFWGGLIGIISVAILFLGIRAFFHSPQSTKSIQSDTSKL